MLSLAQARKRYNREIAVVMVLYLAALFGRFYALPYVANRTLVVAVTLLPVIPILLCGPVVMRFYRCVDEYHRMRFLQVLAISTGVTAAAAASWCFLEDVGIPRLSNYGVVLFIAGTYGVVEFIFRVNDGAADGRIGKSTRALAIASILTAAAAAIWLAIVRLIGLPGETQFLILLAACVLPVIVSIQLRPWNDQ